MSLELRISGPGGVGCTISAHAGSTVQEVKALLQSQLGIPSNEQKLIFQGAELGDAAGLASHTRQGTGQGGRLSLALERRTAGGAAAEWLRRLAEPHGPGHQCLRSAPAWVRADREVLLAAVERSGCALEFASAELRADRDLVLAAVRQSAMALRYAAPDLCADRTFIYDVLKQNGLALGYLSRELRSDRNVVLAAVQEDGAAFQSAAKELREEPGFVLEAARWAEAALEHAVEALWEDADFVLSAAEISARAFDFSAADLWHDRAFVLEAVKRQACALDFAVEELVDDPEFILDAVDCNPKALDFVPAPRHPPATAGAAQARVEVADVAALVSHLLLQIPSKEQAYSIAKVINNTTFEVAPRERPAASPDEFWPPGCGLTEAQRGRLFWKCLRGRLCLPATACLAAALRAACDSGLQLVHEGAAVENVLILHAGAIDVTDLLPGQLSLVNPQAGEPFLIPAVQASSGRQRSEGEAADGETALGATAEHWWLAVVVRAGPKANPEMVHFDLCGPALDIFDCRPAPGQSEGPPPPVHVFRTPAYPLRLWVTKEERRRFACRAAKPPAAPPAPRHLQGPRGPGGGREEGAPGLELLALPLEEFLQQERELIAEVAARGTAAKACHALLQRLFPGVGVRLSGPRAPPKLKGRVGRVAAGAEGPNGRLRVRVGAEDVMLSPEVLKIFPACSLPQIRTFEEMAKESEGVEALFPPGSLVTIAEQQDAPQLSGKRAEVMRYNGASGRYQVRLQDDTGDLKAVLPWHLDARYLDDEAVRAFFASDAPANKTLAAQLVEDSEFPFTMLENEEVVKLLKRLLDAGLWRGYHAEEELMSGLCKLAEHPAAARAMQIMKERERAKDLPSAEAASVLARIDAEVEASHGLKHVFERHRELRTEEAPRWALYGPRHQGPVRLDPFELRRKVGLEA